MEQTTRAEKPNLPQSKARELNPASRWWNWVKDETSETRTLYLNGVIAEETWLGDEISPQQFKTELMDGEGDISVWINSIGGDVFAASQIYNMLRDYKGKVTVKIDGIAASAASVIAMAGSEVLMSPVSMLMVHNPMTSAFGNTNEMNKAIDLLNEVKESIINAYEVKSGLPRSKISCLMDEESWMNAKKAVELGFADGVLFTDNQEDALPETDGLIFSNTAFTKSVLNKLQCKPPAKTGIRIEALDKRLELLKY